MNYINKLYEMIIKNKIFERGVFRMRNVHVIIYISVFIIFLVIVANIPKLMPMFVKFAVNDKIVEIRYVNNPARIGISLIISAFFAFLLWAPFYITKISNDIKEEVARSFYRGFYTLLGNARENFQRIEELLEGNIDNQSIRTNIFNAIIDSLQRMSQSGIVIVDASISDYVRYINNIVRHSNRVSLTCVVRPFWFVMDGVQDIVTYPYIESENEFGKGEHLAIFYRRAQRQPNFYQRIMVVDELMVADIFLTAYIDKVCYNNDWYQSRVRGEIRENKNEINLSEINDLPEIWWFQNVVNRGGVLIYTRVDSEFKGRINEFRDRIYVHEPVSLEISFEFLNLESGLLRIRWGERANILRWIDGVQDNIKWNFGNEEHPIDHKIHKIYTSFRSLLRPRRKLISLINNIQNYLRILRGVITREHDTHNTHIELVGPDASEIERYLFLNDIENYRNFTNCVLNAIQALSQDLNQEDERVFLNIYENLVQHFKKNGVPDVFYAVVNDPIHPGYPIRVIRWRHNWERIRNMGG